MKCLRPLARRLTLNTGAAIPTLGLGTWQSEPQVIGPVIRHAIEEGYRHFDCAAMYKNEAEIGRAYKSIINDGLCRREDLFITSKLSPYDLFPDKINDAVNKTLSDLKLDYLDLYLIHWPHRIKYPPLNTTDTSHVEPYKENWMKDAWIILENIFKEGRLKAIGLSNFSIKKMEHILSNSTVKPAVNQVENHIYFQQAVMKKYLDSKEILMQSYSPLGSPQRSSTAAEDPTVLSDPVVKRIADTHNATPAQICIAFLLRDNKVVLAKSVNPIRLKSNLNSLDIQLTEQDYKDITAVDKNYRLFRARFLRPYSTYKNFWDEDFEAELSN
ncbi:Aldose reductase-like [Oopsacas minuta]|uniref:Aldose reductase-like n=1 Tax=Oopsacas minuta TaxID=111878 RepID=A0AAV7KGX1_9METZ|nr:Aldose reductase-like [Oopsacas minuta]